LPLNEGSGTPKDVSNNRFKAEMSKAAPKWVDGGHDTEKKALEFDGKTNSVKKDKARILIHTMIQPKVCRSAPGPK